MKLKKSLLTGLSFVLVAAIAIGGTLAYLTSEDSDVNVMTLGNVKIAQHEYERVLDDTGAVTGMQKYTQGKPLYPAVVTNGTGNQAWAPNANVDIYYGNYIENAPGGNGTWQNLNNVMDKFVFVQNTGESDAYYRTIILCEYDETQTKNDLGQGMIHLNVNSHNLFTWTPDDGDVKDNTMVVEVNGEKYSVVVATYNAALKPNEISRPSLLQVGMDQFATNEIVAQFGDTYDILVLSQAVQTAGFDSAATALNTAFGEITAKNVAEWFGGVAIPTVASSADELNAALEGDGNVVLTDNITTDANANSGYGKAGVVVEAGDVLDGSGNTYTVNGANGTWDCAIAAKGGTIKNLTVANGFRGIFMPGANGDLYIDNVVFDDVIYTFNSDAGSKEYGVNNCDFGEGSGNAFCRPYGPTKFVNCDFEAGYEIDPRATVTFENCTIGGVALTSSNLSTLVISNIENATVK